MAPKNSNLKPAQAKLQNELSNVMKEMRLLSAKKHTDPRFLKQKDDLSILKEQLTRKLNRLEVKSFIKIIAPIMNHYHTFFISRVSC